MKSVLKRLVVAVLGWQVKRLRKKHAFKTIGVVGSIGKTSTKLAIAEVLSKTLRVRYQHGNYNDIVSVPLIYFGHDMPSLLNPIAWLKIFIANEKQLGKDYPFDVVVVELGTDSPGQIAAFSNYVSLDLAIVTAIAPEHMEFFSDLRAVAAEELGVARYSKSVVYSTDFVPAEFHDLLPEGAISYSLSSADANYHIANLYHSAGGFEGDIKYGSDIFLHFTHEVVAETQLYSLLAAVVIGRELGLKSTQILAGISTIKPVSGRFRRLRGISNSVIIDDTYNASPEAVKAGLSALYKLTAPHKVAILGNMNELGAMSASAHKEIGELCDPKQLELVVTIGPDANTHLAPAAEAKGCRVMKFDSPYVAGEYLQAKIQPESVVFAKGSQNGVFAEEAVKLLLADPEDASKLVRQSDYWLQRKRKAFS